MNKLEELLQKLNNGDMVAYLNPTETEILLNYFECKNLNVEQIGQTLKNCHIALVDELQVASIDNCGFENLSSKISMARKVLENYKMNNFHELQIKSGQMLEKMRNYVEGKCDLDSELKVSYRMINGNENVNYNDLNLGEDFELSFVSFELEPNIGMINNYTKNIFNGKKYTENWDENLRMLGNPYIKQTKEPHHYNMADEKDKEKANEAISESLNSLIVQIFNTERKLDDSMFNDPEFKKLYEEHVMLKQESIRAVHEMNYIRKNTNQQIKQENMEKEGKQL